MSDEFSPPSAGSDPVDAELWRGARPTRKQYRDLLRFVGRMAVPALVIGFVLLLGLYVLDLLAGSRLTPVITLATEVYRWPFPPNAWAAEDLDALSPLVGKTIALEAKAFNGKDGFSASFGRMRPEFQEIVDGAATIIVYVSAHGIVRDGTPYIVPPGASADDSDDWLSVEELLKSIRQVSADSEHVLVVLDCSRLQSNWNLGLLSNDFSAALEQWWNGNRSQDGFQNVAILCSAGPGERAWTSAELGGSVFGHFFALGLAGDADTDANDKVTLGELSQFLQGNVGKWTRTNRDRKQSPMLLPAVADFHLAPKLNTKLPPPSPPALAVSVEERGDLWRSLDELRTHALFRDEPLAWRDLEHKLLWLEQLATSGSAYQELARRARIEVHTKFADIHTRLTEFARAPAIGRRAGIVSGDADEIPALRLRSLALAAYFGSLEPGVIAAARDRLGEFRTAPDQLRLDRAVPSLERLGVGGYVEHQFLQMLRRYQSPQLWRSSARLTQLMTLRDRAESLGVPGGADLAAADERAHYWVRARLSRADEARRAAEDQLFVAGQPELDGRLQEADRGYQSAEQAMTSLNDAMRLRDRVWAEWGYHAQWLATTGGDAVQVHLLPLATETRRLEQLMSDHTPLENAAAADGRIAEIQQSAGRVAGHLKGLAESYQGRCSDLAKADASDGAALLEIEAVLAVPLVTADQRVTLTNQLEKIPETDSPAGDSPVDRADDGDAVAQSLFELLGKDASTITVADRNSKWQETLKELGEQIGKTDAVAPRSQWSALDQKLRSVAPIWSFDRTGGSDHSFAQPFRKLREIDRQALLVWHAERALADFWGPAGEPTPYFAGVTSDYLRSAIGWAHQSGDSPPATAALEGRLNRARAAVPSWLKTVADNVVLLEPGEAAATRVTIAAETRDQSLPQGTAAIILRHQGQPLTNVQFSPPGGVALPVVSQTLDVSIQGAEPGPAGERIDAIAMFRGHEFPGSFLVDRLGGVIVDHVPHDYGPGRVTLHSPWRQLAVVLVLDCSQSMEEPFEGDQSRLDVAKAALQELLGRLGSQRNVHVGVRMFGHRVGWSTDRPVRMLTSPTYAGTLPPELTPESDVELVLPLQLFDFRSAQAVFAALDGVKQGWGQSPLYLSLEQALRDDFLAEGRESRKHVIVITDGRNYQFRSSAGEGGQLADVLEAWQQERVPIHILGLGTDYPDQGPSAAEFTRLAAQTGGVYQNLQDSRDLRATLQSILAPALYRLERTDGTVADQGELGMPLTDAAQQHGDWYAVRFEDKREDVWLEGGEEIELFIDPNDAGLQAFGYDRDVAAQAWLRSVEGSAAADHVFRVHRPVRDERDVHFGVSVQRCDPDHGQSGVPVWRWTRRPREAWVEISPLNPSGQPAGSKYQFYDANYEPEKPVPLLQLVARQWPVGATRASVEAWFKPTETAPDAVVPMQDVPRQEQGLRAPIAEEVMDGVRVQLDFRPASGPEDFHRVRVVERHPAGSIGADALRILYPQRGDARPARVVRQFDDRHGLVAHWFYYSEPDEARLAQAAGAEIAITSRRAAHAECMYAAPVMVELSDAGTLLPLAGHWMPRE